jgi:hypothetical protein
VTLPNKIDNTSPLGSEDLALGDNNIRALKTAIQDIFGVPNNTDINSKLFEVVAAGLNAVFMQDRVTDASVVGTLYRVATKLKYWDGTAHQVAYQDEVLATPPTGVMYPYMGIAPPTGYVVANGNSIGNATSGAVQRANADTINLFTLLWSAFGNTELQIQTSGGVNTTRGASALADFNANMRMPVPDLRGRVVAGLDNMGGGAAGRLPGYDAQGEAAGAATFFVAHHTHVATTSTPTLAAGVEGGAGAVVANQSHLHNVTVSLEGSHAVDIVQPTIALTWIIKL